MVHADWCVQSYAVRHSRRQVELSDLSTKLSGELQELLAVNEENVRSAQQQHSRHLDDLTAAHADEKARSEAALAAMSAENVAAESQVRQLRHQI